jgi:hypothetical protein
MLRLTKWLRYSGASVTITVNPFHWQWIPRAYKENNLEWPEGMRQSYRAWWLFLSIEFWIDNGEW